MRAIRTNVKRAEVVCPMEDMAPFQEVFAFEASFDIDQSSVPFLSSTIQSRLVWAHLTPAK